MARNDALRAEGSIVEVLPDLKYRVQLPNGHRVLAFVIGKAREQSGQLASGDKVILEMSPYDLSKGRIVLNKKILT